MNAVRKEIVLLAPPFSASPNPYISLPTLMGWLNQQNVPSRFLDLARDLEGALLRPAAIVDAYNRSAETFLALNNKASLRPSEVMQVVGLQMLLKKLAGVYEQWKQDDFRRADRGLLLELVSAPHWPRSLKTFDTLQFCSQYNLYSSQDLVRSGADAFFFTPALTDLIHRQIDGDKTLIVGIAVVFDQQVIPAMQCARIIKQLHPQIHVTLGGPFVTIHLRDLRNQEFFHSVDSLILDEGETPLVALHAALLEEEPRLDAVPNLVWRNGHGAVVRNKSAPFVDLARIPAPDYQRCGLAEYPDAASMRLTMRLSKGCYWKRCAFCRVNLSICRNYCQPDAEVMYQRLCEVIDATGATSYLFSDESCAPEILEQISEMLCRDGRKIAWTFHTRIDRKRLTRSRVEKFRDAGCTGFTVGVETYNNRLLTLLNKGIDEEEIAFVLNDIRGIVPVNAYMMLGVPTETEEEYRRSLEKMEQFKKDGLLAEFQYSLFHLAAGSLMRQRPHRYGISRIDDPDGADLLPNAVAAFECEGMSRLQAFHRYLELMSRKIPPKMHEMPVTIHGEKHFSRYAPRSLVESMGELFLKQMDMPFLDWLAQVDQACGPVQGQDPWWMNCS
jgi:radical SAM superfamily enzyme YgiQ (UPF0313 family)